MSLIGDALKRQQEKGSPPSLSISSAPPPAQSSPAQPPPASTSGAAPLSLRSKSAKPDTTEADAAIHAPPKSAKHRPVMELVLLGLGLILLIFVGLAAYNWFAQDKDPQPPAPQVTPKPAPPPSVAGAQTPESIKAESPAVPPVPAKQEDVVPENKSAEPAPEAPQQKTQPAESAVGNTGAEIPVEAPAAKVEAASAAPEPVNIIWPTISIQGAMGNGTSGSVIINGKLILVGDEHLGIKILEITPRGVRVSYEGQERTVPVRR